MSYMFEVYYRPPADSTREAALAERVSRLGGRLDYREALAEGLPGGVGLTVESRTSTGHRTRPNSSRTAQIDFAVSTPARARKSNDVAAADVDAARLAAAAVHGLHVCQQESVGKPLAEGGHEFETPWVLSSGVPISTMSYADRTATVRPRSKVPNRPKSKREAALSRSTTRAELGCVSFAGCWPQAELDRIVSKMAPTANPPPASLPAASRNDRRLRCPR